MVAASQETKKEAAWYLYDPASAATGPHFPTILLAKIATKVHPGFKKKLGRLGGSVGWASDFSSGHDLAVCEFEPRVGPWADGSEPGACFRFCLPLSLCPSLPCTLSFSLKNKQTFF